MYELALTVKDEHIDFQDIVDGLYYPFYFEECCHKFLKDVLHIDIEDYAKKGFNLVLTEYTLKFRASLKKNDHLIVTCHVVPSEHGRSRFSFEQKILCNGKVAAEAVFTGTCVSAAGGRPFIPEEAVKYLADKKESVQP